MTVGALERGQGLTRDRNGAEYRDHCLGPDIRHTAVSQRENAYARMQAMATHYL